MKKDLETITEICPFMNVCAIDYDRDFFVCKDEDYKKCSIYQDYIKKQERN